MNLATQRKARLARSALLGLGALLLGLLALATAGPNRAAAAPATPQVTATAEGDGIRISTAPHSQPPARWEITISRLVPPQGNPPSFADRFIAGHVSLGGAPSASHRFKGLTPGVTYHYIVRAADAAGQSSYATGSVNTLNRDVTVTYKSIRIINDGDGFLRGKGEIRFDFALNNCWVSEWHTGLRSFDDGDRFSPNAARYLSKFHQGTLSLAVNGIEADNDLWDGFSPLPLIPSGCGGGAIEPGRGSNDAFDWARAATTVNFAQSFNHTQNTATETVKFASPSWDGLRFEVEAELKFTYYR